MNSALASAFLLPPADAVDVLRRHREVRYQQGVDSPSKKFLKNGSGLVGVTVAVAVSR